VHGLQANGGNEYHSQKDLTFYNPFIDGCMCAACVGLYLPVHAFTAKSTFKSRVRLITERQLAQSIR